MKLYEIKNEHEAALRQMVESGFDSETIDDSLAAIKDEFNSKAISVVQYIKNVEADVIMIDAEIKRLTDMKKTVKASQDGLKEYLRHNMEAMDIDKIECPLFKITLRKAPKVAEIDDETEIPIDFKSLVPESYRVDKRALLAALKINNVSGARLVDGKRGVTIK